MRLIKQLLTNQFKTNNWFKILEIMKKFSTLILVFTTLFLAFSCSENENIANEDIDFDNTFNNKFILLVEENKFIEYDKEEIITLIKETADLNENITLKDFKLVQNNDEKGNKTNFYSIKAQSADKLLSVATLLEKTNDGFRVLGKTCKCESTNCDIGCEASFFGDRCQCSHCSSECKKTSTATLEYSN